MHITSPHSRRRMHRFLRALRYQVLVSAITPFRHMPILGKKMHHHASHVHFRQEPMKFFGLHGFEGVKFLFLTDIHVGGSIDHHAHEVHQGIQTLLRNTKKEQTYILHGGDFSSSQGHHERLSFVHFQKVMGQILEGTESYKHFAVMGNHDEENPAFSDMRKWLEETYSMHFFTEPRHAKKIFIRAPLIRGDPATAGGGFDEMERNICFHGMHTLATYLHRMKKRERNMLLDQYIYTLNSMHNDLNIVLLHNPDGLEFLLKRLKETKQKIIPPTLFLAGHTHGSMFDVPYLRKLGLFVCRTSFHRYKGWHYPEGKYADTGNWKMYVATGIGNSPGCDLRINAQPEGILFTL